MLAHDANGSTPQPSPAAGSGARRRPNRARGGRASKQSVGQERNGRCRQHTPEHATTPPPASRAMDVLKNYLKGPELPKELSKTIVNTLSST